LRGEGLISEKDVKYRFLRIEQILGALNDGDMLEAGPFATEADSFEEAAE
jgi:hypothetical protein